MLHSADLLDITREGLLLVLLVSVPIFAAALIAWAVTALIQMFTKVSDPTVSNIVRIVAVVGALVVAGPWIAGRISSFADRVWSLISAAVL